jgi:hypothetical protein
MNEAKNVLQGFYFTLSTFFLVFATFFWWSSYSYTALVGLALFLLLAIPLITNVVIRKRNWKKQPTFSGSLNPFLMGIQGFGFACWFLDVITTFTVIDVRGIGTELNSLGWPYGIMGALLFYIPTTIGVYYLSYKLKSKGAFYGAVILAAVTLFMASQNFVAGLINFLNSFRLTQTVTDLVAVGSIYIPIFVILSAINIAEIIITRKRSKQLKPQAITT